MKNTTMPLGFTLGFNKLKVMFMALIFAGLCSLAVQSFSAGVPVAYKGAAGVALPSGDIITVPEVGIALAQSSNKDIVLFQVYDGNTLVYSSQGCYSTSCQYDISSLHDGTYFAVATKDDQTTFSATIQVRN